MATLLLKLPKENSLIFLLSRLYNVYLSQRTKQKKHQVFRFLKWSLIIACDR